MNPVVYILIAGLLAIAYYLGNVFWERITDIEQYYYRILYCGVATAFLTFVLVTVTLFSAQTTVFDDMVWINSLQIMVSLGLFIVLHRKVRWSEIVRYLRLDRKYMAYATLFFVGGLVLGATAGNELEEVLVDQIDEINELADLGQDRPFWQIGIFILGNNTKTAILIGLMLPMIPILGGLYVIFSMLLNGTIVGVIGGILDKPLSYLIVGIVPHGIFEIPAILIAAAIGLKLNSRIIFGLLAAIRNKDGEATTILKGYVKDGVASWKLMYLVIFLLIVAAIIESTVTPTLLDMIK